MNITAYIVAALMQASMAPAAPPFVGTEAEQNDKRLGEEIARAHRTRGFSENEIEREGERLALCLVARQRPRVAALLGSDRAFAANGRQLFGDSGCVRSEAVLEYDAAFFRRTPETARYAQSYPAAPTGTLDAERLRAAASANPDQKLAYCVIQYGPATAHDFVVADAYSASAKAALATLLPAIGQCLPPDVQFEFNRTTMRAMLADALMAYRTPIDSNEGGAEHEQD